MYSINQYNKAVVRTSSMPHRLLRILDQVVALLHAAQKAIEDKDYAIKHRNLSKVTQILYTLHSDIWPSKPTNITDPQTADDYEFLRSFLITATNQLHKINISSVPDQKIFERIIAGINMIRSSLSATLNSTDE